MYGYGMKTTTVNVKQACKDYLAGCTLKEIADKQGKAQMTVYAQLKRVGCPMRTGGKRQVHTAAVRACARLDTSVSAYWYGFVLADGNIRKYRRKDGTISYEVSITAATKDKDHITKFANYVGGTINPQRAHAFKALGRQTPDWEPWAQRMGTGKKFNRLHLPNISDGLLRHAIRGVFDGDGWFTSYIPKPRGVTRRGIAGIIAVSSPFLEEIQEYLARHDIRSRIAYHGKRGSKGIVRGKKFTRKNATYKLVVDQQYDLILFHRLLYRDATVWLERKRDKMEAVLQHRAKAKRNGLVQCNA